MLALWNPRRFADIVDYEIWERQLYDDDILRHVRDCHLFRSILAAMAPSTSRFGLQRMAMRHRQSAKPGIYGCLQRLTFLYRREKFASAAWSAPRSPIKAQA
jgi:hypothetical protein